MTCHLYGVKPLSKPMMSSHESYPKEQTAMKNIEIQSIFIFEIALKFIAYNITAILFQREMG